MVTLFGGGRIEVVFGKNKLPELFFQMHFHVVIGVLEPRLQCVTKQSEENQLETCHSVTTGDFRIIQSEIDKLIRIV